MAIEDISERLIANIPDVFVDLLEIASYIYAADTAIRRGDNADARMGARWRRKLRFIIPVRLPDLWSSDSVLSELTEALSFLSEDEYIFGFEPMRSRSEAAGYFTFADANKAAFTPDEIILFSGGLDSLSGAVEELVQHGKRVALVSHRSSTKTVDVQKHLVGQLQSRFGAERIMHIPVWVTLVGGIGREHTHRSRSFLFAALGAVVARLFRRDRIRFFENGVVSLNLPPVAQVIGARATRTTHPQALSGFRHVLTAICGHRFEIDNPFIWMTKSEVVRRLSANSCGDLIRHTRSCTRIRDMTVLHPHCGQCSQCIDRRFAILDAGQDHEDPADAYKVDLFTGERQVGADREMALAYVRSASAINQMTDIAFFTHYGETSRIVGFFPEPTDTVARRIFELYRRHAATICEVFDAAIASYAHTLREGTLPADCLLSLVVSQREGGRIYPTPSSVSEQVAPGPDIRLIINTEQKRVVLDRWGELTGVNARLIIALADPFRVALRDELAPEHYPFTETSKLMSQTRCNSDETLRRRILRCRNTIAALARKAGGPQPSPDAVIENRPWHGYRLNPDRVRIVAASKLSGG